MTIEQFEEISDLYRNIRRLYNLLNEAKSGLKLEIKPTNYYSDEFQNAMERFLSEEEKEDVESHKNSIKNIIANSFEKRLAELKEVFDNL